MQFTSFDFFIFLIPLLFIFYLSPNRLRIGILLIASYIFYLSFDYKYFLILLLATSITYLSSRAIAKNALFAYIGIISNLGLLFFFKYYLFFRDIVKNLFTLPFIEVILPIGISFYVFQNIAYLIDISKKKTAPEKNIFLFALSVSFFPKIISGPIERSTYIKQFSKNKKFDINTFLAGFEQMLFGFFKKLVIADRLAIVVNQVFGNIELYQGPALIIAVLFYTFQLYADFSGYTDIALGTARLFGIELTSNFKRPYLSRNLSDFWKRWHISLSTFIRDYIYIPLGGSRNGIIRTCINVVISFVLCGLWHGANYTFVMFGFYFGAFIALYNLFKNYYEKIPSFIQVPLTFILVSGSWVFFRSSSISEAFYIFGNAFKLNLSTQGVALGVTWAGLFINIILIFGLMFFEILQEYFDFDLSKQHESIRIISYMILIISIVLFGAFNQVSFVYSQF